jgi:hypothetical protein
MGEIGEKAIEKIKEEKIAPRPRWQFFLKDYLIWLAFFVAVIIGGLAFCVIFFVFLSNDWDLYKYLRVNPLEHFIFSLPYLWVIVLLVFLALAYYNYKHTKSGYRYEAYAVLGLSILASVFLGFLFHFAFGLGEKIDNALSSNLPVYSRIHAYCNRQNIWSQPEKGLLGGRILNVGLEDGFDLEDFQGIIWQIEKDGQVFIREPVLVREGESVKLIGEKRAEKHFWAREIRSWNGWGEDE